MDIRRTKVAAALGAAGVAAALAAGVTPAGASGAVADPAAGAGPVILMGSDGRTTLLDPAVRTVPPNAAEVATKAPAAAVPPAAKLDPRLAAAVRDPAAAKTQRVLIGFAEDVQIPRFPELDPDLARNAPANAAVQSRSDVLVAGIQRQRQAGYQAISSQLGQLGVRTLNTFWLVKGMEVEAPLSALTTIAQRADVTIVQPVNDGSPPPSTGFEPGESVARGLMNTDPVFRLGLTSGFIGILDTGVQANHAMFTDEDGNATHGWIRADMVHPEAPDIDNDPCQHGTRTMGVLNGNSRLNHDLAGLFLDYRGVTDITVDSFRVYDVTGAPDHCGLNATAAVQGFQRAVQVLDRVIVAEMQSSEPQQGGMIGVAADQAYDAGAVVLGANGNTDPSAGAGSVSSPASARRVLGIGAVDPTNLVTKAYQNRGPTADSRVKPDLQTPVDLVTANSHAAGDQSVVEVEQYGGTSAGVAQAAGAAALLRNRMRGTSFDFPPGYVYATLFARGTNSTTLAPYDNEKGAGLVTLATPGASLTATGSAVVTHQQTLDLTVPPINSTKAVHAAIWWPDTAGKHSDIDVSLVDDAGSILGSSVSIGSVFEKITYDGPRTGNVHLRVRGYNVPLGVCLTNGVSGGGG
jgi:serine protease AprX